jgi:hypothetical protein
VSGESWKGDEVALIDCLMGLMVALMAIAFLPHSKPVDSTAAPMIAPLVAELRWGPTHLGCGNPGSPDYHDSDVDLWVLPPGGTPVGYSNKTGFGANLVHDDLGPGADPDSECVEYATFPVIRPGEYVINAMLYSTRSPPPIPVTLIVRENLYSGRLTSIIVRKSITLRKAGDEITIVRFTLDKDGNVVEGSVNDLPMPLRSAGIQ